MRGPMMPAKLADRRNRLVARLQVVAAEHADQPEIAAVFQRIADDIVAGRRPGSATSDDKPIPKPIPKPKLKPKR
jgi:hypothetical protein